jgi:hypothetical protein
VKVLGCQLNPFLAVLPPPHHCYTTTPDYCQCATLPQASSRQLQPVPNYLSGLRLRQYDEALISDPEYSLARFPFLLAVLDPDSYTALGRLQFIQLPKLSEPATSLKIYICSFKYNSIPHKHHKRLFSCTLPHISRTIIAHVPTAAPPYAC